MKKTGVSQSGVFTIKEYLMDENMGIPELIRRLEAGPETVQEILSYVFEGDDPLEIDAKSFSVEEFLKIYPQLETYGPGLAFDAVIRTEGQPVTVEMTQGEQVVCTNSLDKEVELEDLLGECDPQRMNAHENSGVLRPEEWEVQECLDVLRSDAAELQESSEDLRSMERELKAQDMTPKEFLDILSVAERLKCNTRHCDTSSGRRESVAEHSWRTALMAMLLSGVEEYRSYDMNRVIRMCLIHDLGEAFTGDIPTFEKTAEDEKKEISKLDEWVRSFPDAQKREFQDLYSEMTAMETPEARLYKAIDKNEAVIQHNESDISSWLPLEYDLQRNYGQKESQFSPWLRGLREQVDEWTEEKIKSGSEESEQ